jgi:hypothetical protein
MPRIPLLLLLILSCPPAMAGKAEPFPDGKTAFAEAARHYAGGDWAAAERVLEAIPPAKWSADSLLLLGHAEARQGKTVEAMLSYRRVLDLRPGHPEAAQNLSVLARRQGVTEPPAPPPVTGVLISLPGEAYHLGLALGTWLSIAGAAGFLFRRTGGPAIFFSLTLATGVSSLLLVGTAMVVKARALESTPDSPPRVWLPDGQLMEESPLHSEPTRSAERVVETVPPGTALRLVTKQGWSYVEVPSGNQSPLRGWIRNPSWLPLRPGDSGNGNLP